MRPSRYEVIGEGVLAHVDRFAPGPVFEEFYELIEALMRSGPYPQDQPHRGIQPLQDPGKPNGFTAPFDDGLLAYQVMRDLPVIRLVDAFWVEPENPSGPGIGYAFPDL